MFNHIVLYKLKDRSETSKRLLREKFLTMQGNIEQIRHMEVGSDKLKSERSFDVALFIRFDTMQDFLDYKSHPFHLGVTDYVHKVKDQSISLDYED